jgi:NTE family protein
MKFTSDDIGRMIVQGYQAGVDALKENPPLPTNS